MPKVIENLRDRILQCAKESLASEGYKGLTTRDIASRCGIALGTMYNYFNSKDELVGAILGRDWGETLQSIDKGIATCNSLHDGLSIIAMGLEGFCDRYSALWHEFGMTSSAKKSREDRHPLLVNKLSERIESVLNRFGLGSQPKVCDLLAESMISLAVHGKRYEDHSSILERMIDSRE